MGCPCKTAIIVVAVLHHPVTEWCIITTTVKRYQIAEFHQQEFMI
jgi:hypothetical protein